MGTRAVAAHAADPGREVPLDSRGVARRTHVCDAVRLLTWNVYQRPSWVAAFHDDPSLPPQTARLDGILGFLDGTSFDVICVQEAFSHAARRALSARYRHVYALLRAPDSIRLHSGLMILSRHPIVHRDGAVFRGALGGGREVDRWVDKGVMHAEMLLPDGPLHVFNTHLQAQPANADVRRAQIDQLCRRVSRFPGRAVVAGDFNLESDEQANLARLLQLGFRDLWSEARADDSCVTHPPGRRYDFAFSRGLRAEGAKVHATAFSDHGALSVECS